MPPWHLFHFNGFGLPLFLQRLQELGDFQVDGITAQTPAASAAAVLQRAHVYQVSSQVGELPPEYLAAAPLFDRTPRLLVVSTIGAGHDTVDVAECTRRGIAAFHQAGGANAQAVIEHTLALMLALGRKLVQADRELHVIPDLQRAHFVGSNLRGKTVGVIGFGNVGRGLAWLCGAGFGARVLVHTGHADNETLAAAGAERMALDDLLAESDYVAVCCALNARTRGLLGAAQFARMKPGAFFVTAARGGIHDEQALLEALRRGHLGGAGLDVWDMEPPPPDHPLLALPNVIGTPHIGGATIESRTEAARLAADQIAAALRGERPRNLINPEAWPLFLERLAAARED